MYRTFAAACCFAVFLCVSLDVAADEVVTRDTYLVGNVDWTARGVRVSDREVAWTDVVSMRFDVPSTAASGSTVTLQDGERWAVEVLGLSGGQLSVRLGGGTEQMLPLDRVAILTLAPVDAAMLDAAEANTLITEAGESLPGELMWINDSAVAVDSVFGVMQMPRTRVAAYVFSKGGTPSADKANHDQVALVEGTVLSGTLSAQANGLTLEHPVLGRVALDRDHIRSIRRAATGTPLATMTPRLDARPLLTSPRTPVAPTADDASLRIWPGGHATYTVPAAGRLRAIVGALDGSRGASILRIRSGGTVLLEKVIERQKSPEWIAISVPPGEMTIEADFVQPLAIPSGVVLREASLEVGS